MKQFVTEDSFWELFPETRIGIVVAQNMRQVEEVPEEDVTTIQQLLAEANRTAQKHLTSDTISLRCMFFFSVSKICSGLTGLSR